MLARNKGKHSEKSILQEEIKRLENSQSNFGGEITAKNALTVNEVLENTKKKTTEIPMSGGAPAVSPLEALRQKATRTAQEKTTPAPKSAATVMPKEEKAHLQKDNSAASLLERCMPYITEGGGKVEEEKPSYTLESIDKIIKTSDERTKELIERLSRMGTVTFDDLSKTKKPAANSQTAPPTNEKASDSTVVFTKPQEIKMTAEPTIIISDIDNFDNEAEKTVSFDSVSETAEFEDISSGTKILDLEDKIFETDKTENKRIITDEYLAPEQFKVENDYYSFADAKRIGTDLLKKSRYAGIRLIATTLCLIALLLAQLPSINDFLRINPSVFGTVSAGILLLMCIINFDIFAAVKTLFTPRPKPEGTLGISAVFSLIFTLNCLSDSKNPYNWVLFFGITLLFKCIAVSMRNTYILNNFRIIATKKQKRAIKFVDDRQITFAMAKNSVEGDTLVGMSTKCETVQEFLKHTLKDSVMNGNLKRFTVIMLIIASVGALGMGIFNSSISSALETYCIVLGFGFAPTILFTDILPLMRASNVLNKKGAMIAGTQAAKDTELANAVAVRSVDIFPSGTVTLGSLQAIGENDINRTLFDAAAVLKQIESPLYDIFEKIIKTSGKDLPTADTIKYEENMGVSGWVDNRHIFIGNRTLLTAHGIKTPDLNLDKKILSNGNFPVYIAVGETPCALLSVKYNVDTDIAEDITRITNSGVVVLVDSCDQNVTSQMVCDYFGLADGSVYVMGSSGAELYKNSTQDEDGISSGAAYKDGNESIFAVFSQAAKIKRTVSSLSIYHIVATVILIAVTVYKMYFDKSLLLSSSTASLYMLASVVVSYIVSLFNK